MTIIDDCRVLDDRYRLDRWVAAGQSCDVWRATDILLRRPVTVKVLRADLAADPRVLSMFREEVRQASSVTHENVARIYDYNDAMAEHPPFLVMEFVDGASLADLLRDGPLSLRQTLGLVAQAAAGLSAAHRAGIVHDDVKPANVLLAAGEKVKLTDFGMARVTKAGTGAPRHDCGTPAYLAPECAIGQTATAAADLYALGVIAYECLLGQPPFTGRPVQVAIAHLRSELPDLPAAIPPGVTALIGQLTAKLPEDRPRNAAEVGGRATGLRREMDGRDSRHQAGRSATSGQSEQLEPAGYSRPAAARQLGRHALMPAGLAEG
jgi:eukaryotic-like serine/threonine-protein kinase